MISVQNSKPSIEYLARVEIDIPLDVWWETNGMICAFTPRRDPPWLAEKLTLLIDGKAKREFTISFNDRGKEDVIVDAKTKKPVYSRFGTYEMTRFPFRHLNCIREDFPEHVRKSTFNFRNLDSYGFVLDRGVDREKVKNPVVRVHTWNKFVSTDGRNFVPHLA